MIQCATPANNAIFYWYLDGDRIIPMTNNDLNNPGWARPYTSNRLDDAWQYVFQAGNNGVTIETFSNHLDPHQASFASRLIGIMTQCEIWIPDGNNIIRNPEVEDFAQCQARLQEFYNAHANHVQAQVNANNGQGGEQQQFNLDQGNGDNVQQPPAGHQPLANDVPRPGRPNNHNPNEGNMPNEAQHIVLAKAIADKLIKFKSEDDGINANTTMDDKLNQLYDWNMPEIPPDFLIELEGDTSASRTISLKNLLNLQLNDITIPQDIKIERLKWFVNDWGQIPKRKNDYDRFTEWLENRQNIEENGTLNENENAFDRIASWSKVACIINPNEYAIYDARVAHSLNCIIYLSSNNLTSFPNPGGRNTKIAINDDTLNKILSLSMNNLPNVFSSYRYKHTRDGRYKLDNEARRIPRQNGYAGYKLNRGLINEQDPVVWRNDNANANAIRKTLLGRVANGVIDRNNAYQQYITLLKQISDNLFEDDDGDRLQKTEMLLFALADHKELFIQVIQKLQQQIRANSNPVIQK